MFVLVHGSIFEASGVMFDTSLWIGYLGGAPNRSCGYMMGTTSWLVLYSYGYISSIFEASGIEFDTSLHVWIVLEYLSARPNNLCGYKSSYLGCDGHNSMVYSAQLWLHI